MTNFIEHDDRRRATPRCAICTRWRPGDRRRVMLTRGVTVWLCVPHAAPQYQRRGGGADFRRELQAVWEAAGCLTPQRIRALDEHLAMIRRLEGPPARRRPGTYTWRALRDEAERRWAAGEDPAGVIAALRERAAGGAANPPSTATMRRWWREGHWLTEDVADPELAVG